VILFDDAACFSARRGTRRYAPEALDILLPLQCPGAQQVIEHLTHPRAR